MIFFKNGTKFFVFLLIFYGVSRFCHHYTKGFSLAKIEKEFRTKTCNETPLFSQPELLNQPFFYFSRGKQSFVFLSEDGKYVIKLFNNTYSQKIQRFQFISQFPFLKNWALKKADYFTFKQARAMQSYQIAKEKMEEKTALCYLHLTPSQDLPQTLTLVDSLNSPHTLNPNTIPFLIQKKVPLFYPTLKEMIVNNQIPQAKKAISSLIDLFFWKYRQGIADSDPLIRTNYGLIETQAIQLDLGPLSVDPSVSDPIWQCKEVTRVMQSLRDWLKKNGEELLPFLDQELERQLSSRGCSN